MIVLHWPPLPLRAPPPPPSKLAGNSRSSSSFSRRIEAFPISSRKFDPKFSVKCPCSIEDEHTAKASEDFSVLEPDIPWDSGSTWSTLALYMFSLHVPLSFGGLSVVASVLHQPVLDPQTVALSILVIQMLELSVVLWLIRYVTKPEYNLLSFFQAKNQSKVRNWFLASVLGFGFLILVLFFTSLLAEQLNGPKLQDVNNPILNEILSNDSISKTACILVYCLVTPLLEEIVYRGLLLTSLASEMKWHQAVVVSSAVFSAAHFSGENFLQLFVIGSVLGCSYCWTGNLSSSFAIHSLYNALILVING